MRRCLHLRSARSPFRRGVSLHQPTLDELRIFVYDWLIARGSAPKAADIGRAFGADASAAHTWLAEARVGKTLLVDPNTRELWMAGPFSAVPTDYVLTDGTVTWWANCAWDMFGVAVVLGRALRASTHCPDCGSPMTVTCDPQTPPRMDGLVHFLVPARRWYDDVGFT